MTQGAAEKRAGGTSPASSVGLLSEGKNERAATPANAERNAERSPHLFKPGQSGNPAGKKPGTRNRATRALEELLDGEGEALTRKAVNRRPKLTPDRRPILTPSCHESWR